MAHFLPILNFFLNKYVMRSYWNENSTFLFPFLENLFLFLGADAKDFGLFNFWKR